MGFRIKKTPKAHVLATTSFICKPLTQSSSAAIQILSALRQIAHKLNTRLRKQKELMMVDPILLNTPWCKWHSLFAFCRILSRGIHFSFFIFYRSGWESTRIFWKWFFLSLCVNLQVRIHFYFFCVSGLAIKLI